MHRWLRHRRRGKRTPAVLLGLRWGHYGWCERNGEVMLLEAMVSEHILVRARSGDADAFRELVDPYRGELQFHCYRILGSLQDAEDLLQETLLAAWRGLERFEGRASLRAWLYRIATNRCLNSLRDRRRRPKELQPMTAPPEPTRLSEPIWLEPYPDILLEGVADTAPGPEARYETRESIGLVFAAALQHLPPRQRAALVLCDAPERPSRHASRPETASSRRCPTRRANANSWAGSPTPSSTATPTASSLCWPTARGSRCRPSPTSTRATPRSPGSSTNGAGCSGLTSGSCPRAPTVSPRSAAIARIPGQRSCAPTG